MNSEALAVISHQDAAAGADAALSMELAGRAASEPGQVVRTLMRDARTSGRFPGSEKPTS